MRDEDKTKEQLIEELAELRRQLTSIPLQLSGELRESEHFLNSVFESINDRLTVIDRDFNILRTNSKNERAFSHALPFTGKKCYQVYHGADDVCPGCPSLKALETGRPANAVVPMRDRSGKYAGWLDHYSTPFIDVSTGELKGVLVYARDITEKVRTDLEMARLERFHLIGRMAAGIGHEIRNPMTTVRGFLQLLGSKREYSRHRGYFEIMITELDRADSIIREYLSLARDRPVDLREMNLNGIVEVLYPLISADAINAGIDTDMVLGELPDVLLNENEIRQLILNLVKNGLEAMGNGGKLTIKTFADKEEVVLLVQDQGPGIKPELMDKIGTPFFSTKDNGTGLGLAVCYGIASRHNAAIAIETGAGGTSFFVRFKIKEQ